MRPWGASNEVAPRNTEAIASNRKSWSKRFRAWNTGVKYEFYDIDFASDENNRLVNEWLVHHMDKAPFDKLCYNFDITAEHINDYLSEHGNDSALAIDTIYGMNPLQMLSMNPNAPSDAFAALLNLDV